MVYLCVCRWEAVGGKVNITRAPVVHWLTGPDLKPLKSQITELVRNDMLISLQSIFRLPWSTA